MGTIFSMNLNFSMYKVGTKILQHVIIPSIKWNNVTIDTA